MGEFPKRYVWQMCVGMDVWAGYSQGGDSRDLARAWDEAK
jgi:hypothetical protein